MKKEEPHPTNCSAALCVSEWLLHAENKLATAKIPSPKLDAEIILSRAINRPRTVLHAFPNKRLSKQQLFHANNWLNKRSKRIPIAYILGEKEFYGRSFRVTKDVLIPRPESENLIELYKKFIHDNDILLDIGTGSGTLAITAFLEFKDAQIKAYASDISTRALEVAHTNADTLKANVKFIQSDLLIDIPENIKQKTTVIIANLPYVNVDWVDQNIANELHYEPRNALYTNDKGLGLIKKLVQQSSELSKLRLLFIEADPEQHKEIIDFANNLNLKLKDQADYCLVFSR